MLRVSVRDALATAALSMALASLTAAQSLAPPVAVRIAVGEQLTFRVLDSVSSDASMARRALRAILSAPLIVDGEIIVAPGAPAFAHIERTGTDSARRHVLRISFDSLDANGTVTRLAVRVTSVDNAREKVDSDGLIAGPPAGRTMRGKKTWALMAFGIIHPVAAAALFGVSKLGAREREREVRYAPGTDFATVVTEPLTLSLPVRAHAWVPILPIDSLRRIVQAWPVNTEAEKGRVGADALNMALLGDSADIVAAFRAAGWTSANRMSLRADVATFVRAAEDRGYAHQPISTLLMNGQPAALMFERVTNTFAKRHHVRIWRWSDRIDGSPVWLASASHDVAITFVADRRHFTHKVDPALDQEREKLTADLWLAGCIAARSDVPRNLPGTLRVNDGKDPITTDGALVMLRLRRACETGRAR